MGSFSDIVRESRRIDEKVFGGGSGSATETFYGGPNPLDVAKDIKRTQIEAANIGPPATAMTGGLSTQRDAEKEKRRRRLSLMTGGLGSATTTRPGLLGV